MAVKDEKLNSVDSFGANIHPLKLINIDPKLNTGLIFSYWPGQPQRIGYRRTYQRFWCRSSCPPWQSNNRLQRVKSKW
jgi:hypothetical protein